MKRNNKKGVYRVAKRNTHSSYSHYYSQAYSQQNNQHISSVSYNASHSPVSTGPKTSNVRIYNNGNEWLMHHPGKECMQQYYRLNTGSPRTNQMSVTMTRNTKHFPTPPNMNNRERVRNDNSKRKWSREDAIRAIQFEEEFCKENTNPPYLIIRFPDPPLNPEIVKGFSKEIDVVHFQNNSCPRFCFVRLKDNADTAKVIEHISKIPFGIGHLSAETRVESSRAPSTKPESKQKPIRHAFLHFDTIEKAIGAFKGGLHLQIDGHIIILRFRRAQLNIPSDGINSVEIEGYNDDTPLITNSTKTHTKNDPVVDLTRENAFINTNEGNIFLSTPSSQNGSVKTEEPEEDKNTSNSMQPIKEEHYDSEYSCEDECSNSYFRRSLDNLESINIKSEHDHHEQTSNTNYTMVLESNDNCDKGVNGEKNRQYSLTTSVPLKNCLTGGTKPDSFAKRLSYEIVQDRNKITVGDNFISVEPSRASLSEKKYIENLYDQLNSSKVFKKEVRSEFDELEEMLRVVD